MRMCGPARIIFLMEVGTLLFSAINGGGKGRKYFFFFEKIKSNNLQSFPEFISLKRILLFNYYFIQHILFLYCSVQIFLVVSKTL